MFSAATIDRSFLCVIALVGESLNSVGQWAFRQGLQRRIGLLYQISASNVACVDYMMPCKYLGIKWVNIFSKSIYNFLDLFIPNIILSDEKTNPKASVYLTISIQSAFLSSQFVTGVQFVTKRASALKQQKLHSQGFMFMQSAVIKTVR